jgi:hypothetical protein
MLLVAVVALGVVAAGCSSVSESEQATQFLDQWAADWTDSDEEAVFEVFLPDGVLVGTDGRELVGEEAARGWTQFVPLFSLERTGDAVDNGDGSYSFTVEFIRAEGTLNRVLTITMDGDELVSIVETDDS